MDYLSSAAEYLLYPPPPPPAELLARALADPMSVVPKTLCEADALVGSLRNVAWYRQHMRALKAEHAQLRIAIVHVDAPADVVLRRAAKRARNTGREVPRALLLETLEAVPASVAALSPEADFVCRIHNGDAGVPTLTTPGLAWADFTAQWEQECRRDSYLAPICVDAEATPRPKYFV